MRRILSNYQRCLLWDIENFFARIKEFRRIATRYDKTATSFAAFIYLSSTILALR